jgi:hypothetical protein
VCAVRQADDASGAGDATISQTDLKRNETLIVQLHDNQQRVEQLSQQLSRHLGPVRGP